MRTDDIARGRAQFIEDAACSLGERNRRAIDFSGYAARPERKRSSAAELNCGGTQNADLLASSTTLNAARWRLPSAEANTPEIRFHRFGSSSPASRRRWREAGPDLAYGNALHLSLPGSVWRKATLRSSRAARSAAVPCHLATDAMTFSSSAPIAPAQTVTVGGPRRPGYRWIRSICQWDIELSPPAYSRYRKAASHSPVIAPARDTLRGVMLVDDVVTLADVHH